MNQDLEHLRLLAIFHRVMGVLTGLIGCVPLVHLAVGIGLVSGGIATDRNAVLPMAFMGWFFIGIAVFFIGALWTLAVFLFRAARCLESRRRYTLCLVVAAISCTMAPFGTVLGVFTIVVLVRPSVKALFAEAGGSPA